MSTNGNERLRRVLAGRLESLQQAGVLELPKSRVTKRAKVKPVKEPAGSDRRIDPLKPASQLQPLAHLAESRQTTIPPPVAAGNSVRTAENATGWPTVGDGASFCSAESTSREMSTAPTLAILQQEVARCTRCDELASARTQTVFGVGNPHARLCFLGEAPGADEDRQGEPFVGRAGQLLNKIVEACKMQREDVYICNILKCRPPDNRNPLPTEAANCRRFLERQLEFVAPEFICCLGTVAAQNLFGRDIVHRQAARQGSHVPRCEGDLHLSPGLLAAQPGRQKRHLGRHEVFDA